jgi:hypothetical protein
LTVEVECGGAIGHTSRGVQNRENIYEDHITSRIKDIGPVVDLFHPHIFRCACHTRDQENAGRAMAKKHWPQQTTIIRSFTPGTIDLIGRNRVRRGYACRLKIEPLSAATSAVTISGAATGP